jgi:uncharacterized membrane protein
MSRISKLLRESHHSRHIFSQHKVLILQRQKRARKKVQKKKLIQFHICILKKRGKIFWHTKTSNQVPSLSLLSKCPHYPFARYTVCLKGKCTDFPMDELEM